MSVSSAKDEFPNLSIYAGEFINILGSLGSAVTNCAFLDKREKEFLQLSTIFNGITLVTSVGTTILFGCKTFNKSPKENFCATILPATAFRVASTTIKKIRTMTCCALIVLFKKRFSG